MHYFSNRALIALVALVFYFGPIHGNNWEPCGDWIAYNDEKCFKILDDTLRTFDEAKDVCVTQVQTSTLAVIRSSEEQQFLSDYLFKTEQKLENFWIGAKYSSQNGSFIWIDNSSLNYTNWDAGHSPQSLADYCIHMQADVRVAGKWKDGRCGKKNAVVCQRMQFWTTEFLQKSFLDSRKQQRDALDTIRNLTQSLASANQRIATQKESLQNAYQRIDAHKQNMESVNQRIDELKQSLESSNTRINEQKQNLVSANARINEQKQNLVSANARINEQKQNLVSANARINEQKQNLASANARIDEQKLNLESANARINEQKQNLASANARIDEQKLNLESANARINEQKQNFASANARIDEQKLNLESANARINEQKQNLASANARKNEQKLSLVSGNPRINEQAQCLIPIGFIYTQLPNEKDPSQIWPSMVWTDVSSQFAGVFFRVSGGGAESFGQVQGENSPQLSTVEYMTEDGNFNETSLVSGQCQKVRTAGFNGAWRSLKFCMSSGEIQPRNMAVRIWKRTL